MKQNNKQIKAFTLIRKAEIFIGHEAYPEAELLLRDAIALDGNNPEGFYLLGEALCKQQKFGDSIISLEIADSLLPDNPQIRHLLGWANFMNGCIDEGRILMTWALKKQPDNTQFLCDLAVLENQSGNGDASLAYAQQALDLAPTDPMAQEVFQIVSTLKRLRSAYKKTVN